MIYGVALISNRFSPLSNTDADKVLVVAGSAQRNIRVETLMATVNCILGARVFNIEPYLKLTANSKQILQNSYPHQHKRCPLAATGDH